VHRKDWAIDPVIPAPSTHFFLMRKKRLPYAVHYTANSAAAIAAIHGAIRSSGFLGSSTILIAAAGVATFLVATHAL
jgi:hypothetical protein